MMAAAFRVLVVALMCLGTDAIAVTKEDSKLIVENPGDDPYWPFKGGNLYRSGHSTFQAPFNITKLAWAFTEPDSLAKSLLAGGTLRVFHSSPVIDNAGNSYIVSTTGYIYSLKKDGALRWQFRMWGRNPGNPAMYKGVVFASCENGWAYAIKAATGKLKWAKKIGVSNPTDVYSLIVHDDKVLFPTNIGMRKMKETASLGNVDLAAHSTKDGTFLWNYHIPTLTKHKLLKLETFAYNMNPAIVDDNVVFSDSTGGLYCITLSDGKEVWKVVSNNARSFSTGGVAVGPNKVVYVTHNIDRIMSAGRGLLRAHDSKTGNELWRKYFKSEANAAPAVGPVGPARTMAVIVATGENPLPDTMHPMHSLRRMLLVLPTKLEYHPKMEGHVFAINAETGKQIWSFETEPRHSTVPAGWSMTNQCYPDQWGAPLIGADGTVYMNWSGGKSFSLRDIDDDGIIDRDDDLEVSYFMHGSGTNGQTASMPGLLVVPSCNHIYAFKA